MKISDAARRLIFVAASALLLVWGCSGGGETDTDTGPQVAAKDSSTIEAQIEGQLNRMMDRLRYGDRSALWENEFPYVREGFTFDQYLEDYRISAANADSVSSIEVQTIDQFGDSLRARIRVHFDGPSGTPSALTQDLTMFRIDGRWIRPTISLWEEHERYNKVMQEAIEAAKREAGE